MTVQDFGPAIPNRGGRYTWSHNHQPRYDPLTKETALGTYYFQQNAKSGYMFFGGEQTTAAQSISADDTQPVARATQHLQSKLETLLGIKATSARVISQWRGVMGYTADKLPLVSAVPGSVSGRGGNGEWIAAGFNGMGMCYAWGAGKATAKAILGQGMTDSVPKAFVLSDERLRYRLHPEASVESLVKSYAQPSVADRRRARL
jgi:glycine/D-amino acid oxidase-like deaminating enzyme